MWVLVDGRTGHLRNQQVQPAKADCVRVVAVQVVVLRHVLEDVGLLLEQVGEWHVLAYSFGEVEFSIFGPVAIHHIINAFIRALNP